MAPGTVRATLRPGLTLDYGPFGWMEQFDPQYSPNMSDGGRRYCYIRQPEMAAWNLQQLADALVRARLLSGKQAKAGLRGIRGRGEMERRGKIGEEGLGRIH